MHWREKLKQLKDTKVNSLNDIIANQKEIKGRRLCINNGSSAAFVQDENGDVYIKSGPSTGMVIDNSNNVVTLSGNKLVLMFKEIDMYSMPFQWRYNKFTVNALPSYAPGMGMLLPDAPLNIASGLQGMAKQFLKNI